MLTAARQRRRFSPIRHQNRAKSGTATSHALFCYIAWHDKENRQQEREVIVAITHRYVPDLRNLSLIKYNEGVAGNPPYPHGQTIDKQGGDAEMASWDVDELESQLLFREEDKDGIEAEIRRITGNRNIELRENDQKDGLVAGRLEADGERWPCGDVGPVEMQGMVRIASLFEKGSVLGFCDSYSDFYRLETRADGRVLAKRLSAGDAYETLRWDVAPFTKQYLFGGDHRHRRGRVRCRREPGRRACQGKGERCARRRAERCRP